MKKRSGFVVAALLLPGAVWGGGADRARALVVEREVFREPQIVLSKSLPPQFELILLHDAPTPGYAFDVDSVDREPGRIRVRVTQKRPDGIAAQVITPTRLRIPLGLLDRGTYVLELWMRRGKQEHAPVQSLVLTAS